MLWGVDFDKNLSKILSTFINKELKLTNNGCYVTINVTVTVNKQDQCKMQKIQYIPFT